MLSTNADRNGKTFVSAVESYKYPIYGTQFHPEKPMFEWATQEGINHSYDSVIANTYFADFLVNEARKNFHTFASPQEEFQSLIYNFKTTYTLDVDYSYTECYIFN